MLQNHNYPSTGWTLHNLGQVYSSLGKTEQAQEYYKRAFNIRKKVRDRRGVGWTLHNLSELFYNQQQYDLALATLLVAQKIFEEAQSQASMTVQTSIDDLDSKIGDKSFNRLLSKIKPQADQIVEQTLSKKAP